MIIGIIYELNTIDFFKQFGFNSYKTEYYNVIVLNDSKYANIEDLNKSRIGHLDSQTYQGLTDALNILKKEISFEEKNYDDILSLSNNLIKQNVIAIILEDAQIEIIMEENPEIYNKFKVIDKIEVKIKIKNLDKRVDVTKDAFNVYISGIDTYGTITKVSRSDVNMLVTVNPKTHEILLTNIPRDYYVMLPSFKEYDKLTHAGIYGIPESIGAIENLLDTKINYYVKVNFTSLESLVDALDGITINSNYAFTSVDGYYYSLGENTLNGAYALSFARERKAFSEGDRIRGENQQIVLEALINKITSPAIITNYASILKSMKDKFVTNITEDEINAFIKYQISNNIKWHITTNSLNGTDSYQYTYSYKGSKLYVMLPDQESVIDAKNRINNILSN